jgi:hypothetical protein
MALIMLRITLSQRSLCMMSTTVEVLERIEVRTGN